ncbi:MAG TPA: glycine C-acetyltransferase [Oligoflexia bacterium]|nr:glycine C-acetyltransferase [Oligoflexia bacterium]HMR23884.1 glycine C-acetyltransferase [Oligoflexia bacterium]
MTFNEKISNYIHQLKEKGEYKRIQTLLSAQDAQVEMKGYDKVMVFSSNNYLGLANESSVKDAMKKSIDVYGAGTASVRFICGTLGIHQQLEQATADLVGTEAATTYASCWNANEAVFQTLFGEGDILISDALNHASIIDGMRLAKKVDKKVYQHSDMNHLENILKESSAYENRVIITDGVFSMEGDIAKLPEIIALAKKYNAIIVIDDSHSTGVLGATGRGTAEHFDLMGQVDIITGTYGKALGGAAGGFIAGKKDVVDYCVQQSRPQLFSNALPPAVAASALQAIQILVREPERVEKLRNNAKYFRRRIKDKGLNPLEGDTPIVPIIVGETSLAIKMSERLLEEGLFVTGFGFPVVPKGEARLRIQISSAHNKELMDQAIEKIANVYAQLN